jgi:hypothetical protein
MPIVTIGIVNITENRNAAAAISAILSPLDASVTITTLRENKPPAMSHMAPHDRRKSPMSTAGRVVSGPPKMIIQELSGSAFRNTNSERSPIMWCTIPTAIPAVRMLRSARR